MKPKSWKECPGVVLESLLWDLELEYDIYESSKAETIHHITCNSDDISSYNEELIRDYWDNMTASDFRHRLLNVKQHLEWQLENVKAYLS